MTFHLQVWIYQSRLHLIPLSHVSLPSRRRGRRKFTNATDSEADEDLNDDEEDGWIAPEDAVKFVRDDSIATFASGEVEASVWRQTSGYMFHNTS